MTKREYIIASAGHGKTEQITDFVLEFGNSKKVLVLTHTNAGIHSLTKRLRKRHIDQDKYDLHTIDSFCITYAKAYPKTSGIIEVPKTNEDYEKCRKGVLAVFRMDFLQNFLKNRYSLIIVDEYQDCSESQHNLILKITENIDCIILGDPMQGIFNFGTTKLVTWDNIRNTFSKHPKELLIPHRWAEGREKLGEWLKKTREAIINGDEISFEGDHIHFFEISEKHKMTIPIFNVLNKYNDILIIVKDESMDGNARKHLAKNFHGIIQIIDPMDFKMFYDFLEKLISSNNKELFENIIFFFKNCITRSDHFVGKLTTKIQKLWSKKNESITELRKKRIVTNGDRSEIRKKGLNTLYQLTLDVIETTEVKRTKSMILLPR
ncbi:MAG: hypothetical protein ACD_51C00364G0002 [uncultured bacterium]|nr:MAG: hypothetical protein ACD_51C00364G0002 [uncultured bacterium]